MPNHLLEYIEIKDFKCFKDFKAEGFKRVNLIGGKNNVGKTAFMEACYINVFSNNNESLSYAIAFANFARCKLNYIDNPINFFDSIDRNNNLQKTLKLNCQSNLNNSFFEIIDKDGITEYSFNINGKESIINKNNFSYNITPHPNQVTIFIDTYGFSNNDMKILYTLIQSFNYEKNISEYIHKFEPNLIEFKIFADATIKFKTKDSQYHDISEYGDGLRHFISIICSLYVSANGYLFIDEIENGFHYSFLDKLWEIILSISKEQNIQVFATTHSKECIESYARVSKKLEDEEISFIELGRDKENKLSSIVYPYDWFTDEISQNHEVRGW